MAALRKPCLIPGCKRLMSTHSAKNMCATHYQKAYWSTRSRVDGGLREAKWFRRDHLVREVAELIGLSQEKTKPIVNAVVKSITGFLQNGEEVSVPGFGKFLIHRRSKNAYGPNVYFLPSKQLVYLVKHPEHRSE